METNKYSKAYVEVLAIINYLPITQYKKIPREKIEFYQKNMDNNYKFKIDPNKNLQSQNFSKEAKAIIISLFMDYFATEEKKQQIQNILDSNQITKEKEKRIAYNPDDIFKKNNTHTTEQNIYLQTIPENKNILKVIFNKILEFIKR